jgi:hypothetical protein
MSITIEEKINHFKDELERIFDKRVREFTSLCIGQAPDYFFLDCPASSSGKYHPISELGADGTLIHTKKVFTVAYELCRGLGCEDNRDLILSACIIHDLLKQGKEKSGHTVKNHPDLASQLITDVYNATKIIPEESYKMIHNCVGYHYGLWSDDSWKKPLVEYTPEEICVYISDYVASKRFIEVDYRR